MKKMTILGFLIFAILSCANETIAPDTGSLEIKVTIGPLCPVEPCSKSTEQIKQIYEAYSFVVSDTKSKKVVLEPKITHSGTNGFVNAISLPVGDYELDLKPQNPIKEGSFPKPFKIEKDKVTKLDILIDTGIR